MVLVLGGVLYLSPEAVGIGSDHPLPDATTFGAAALLVIYAFVGWEAAVIPAGESKKSGTRYAPGFDFSTDYGYGALHPHSGRRLCHPG